MPGLPPPAATGGRSTRLPSFQPGKRAPRTRNGLARTAGLKPHGIAIFRCLTPMRSFGHNHDRNTRSGGISIPARSLIAKELAELLGAIAHPHRLRILIELHAGERDVNGLQELLGISHSSVSQNLAILRAHHLVRERRQGRHVYYSLTNPEMAEWLLQGLRFLEGGLARHEDVKSAVENARRLWLGEDGNQS